MNDLLPKKAVCIFAFAENGKVLSVTRRNTEIWSLPGGKVDPSETLEVALQREMVEETGLWVPLSQINPIYSEVVSGKDGKDFYCTAYWTSRVFQARFTENDYTWSKEVGIKASFISVDELLQGAFSDYNKRALDSLYRVKLFKEIFYD